MTKQITKDQRINYLVEEIISSQKKTDKLLNNLYKLDEQSGQECCELLREENY